MITLFVSRRFITVSSPYNSIKFTTIALICYKGCQVRFPVKWVMGVSIFRYRGASNLQLRYLIFHSKTPLICIWDEWQELFYYLIMYKNARFCSIYEWQISKRIRNFNNTELTKDCKTHIRTILTVIKRNYLNTGAYSRSCFLWTCFLWTFAFYDATPMSVYLC